MKNKYRILKIVITVILLGFLLSFSLKRFSKLDINDDMVSVKLNTNNTPVYFIDEKDIRTIVRQDNPKGTVGGINIPNLEKKLNKIPAIDSANVYLSLNGKLNLDISQRVPIFRVNYKGKDFYVDEKGIEFPISRNYSHPCMLVTGNITPDEYESMVNLVKKIENDPFCKKYFIGISKDNGNYNLLTSDGFYKVELGNLEQIDIKIKGFKTLVEKFLIFNDPQMYKKISVKYDNQIITTLNPKYGKNDSIINARKKELIKNTVANR